MVIHLQNITYFENMETATSISSWCLFRTSIRALQTSLSYNISAMQTFKRCRLGWFSATSCTFGWFWDGNFEVWECTAHRLPGVQALFAIFFTNKATKTLEALSTLDFSHCFGMLSVSYAINIEAHILFCNVRFLSAVLTIREIFLCLGRLLNLCNSKIFLQFLILLRCNQIDWSVTAMIANLFYYRKCLIWAAWANFSIS